MSSCSPVGASMNDENLVAVLGQQIRVDIRSGTGTPLVLCNGIGASLEVLDPFVAELDPDTTVVRFDIPGSGASPDSPFPYRFPYLAAVLGMLLKKIGIIDRRAGISQVDVLGLSWGGALAQQFAFQNPHRCRSLILASTGTGSLMIPGKPSVLAKDVDCTAIPGSPLCRQHRARDLRRDSPQRQMMIKRVFDRQLMAGSRVGYMHQLLAGAGWTGVFMLPLVRQRTLIVAGRDDPVIPLANAKIMNRLLPNSALHIHNGGHAELITNAAEQARVIEEFRRKA